MKGSPGHFECTHTPNLPELFNSLQITLAISTYQAGKIIFISAKDNDSFIQLPRNFHHAMAIGIDGNRLAVATRKEVIVLGNAPGLASAYPKKPETYDGLFVPRAIYYTGQLDIHGLFFYSGHLWAVNTLFSCLCTVDDEYSFKPVWKPPFITGIASEDRCHLNGISVGPDGAPAYATTFSKSDEMQGWRKAIPRGGTLLHIPSGSIISDDLPMPHSPRMYGDKLYLLLSATGELAEIDTSSGRYHVVKGFSGFVRGMTKYKDYLFVGLSKLRKNSSTFKDLTIADRSDRCAVYVLHIPTAGIVGQLEYKSGVEEIFDLQIIPGFSRPGILSPDDEIHQLSLTTPETTFWAKPNQSQE